MASGQNSTIPPNREREVVLWRKVVGAWHVGQSTMEKLSGEQPAPGR